MFRCVEDASHSHKILRAALTQPFHYRLLATACERYSNTTRIWPVVYRRLRPPSPGGYTRATDMKVGAVSYGGDIKWDVILVQLFYITFSIYPFSFNLSIQPAHPLVHYNIITKLSLGYAAAFCSSYNFFNLSTALSIHAVLMREELYTASHAFVISKYFWRQFFDSRTL